MQSAADRREALKAVYEQARGCEKCPQLAATRTTVVFGAGNADADLMFVGEAPGAERGPAGPAVRGLGRQAAGEAAGGDRLARADVFIANVLKCRPPGNRDPHPTEIEACQDYLWRQIDLIQPRVLCTLGNFSTKLLRGDPTGITRLHGSAEVRIIGPRAVRLYPIYHPAAALYTPSMLDTLRADFARIPGLLAQPAPDQPEPVPEVEPEVVQVAAAEPEAERVREADQLGLF